MPSISISRGTTETTGLTLCSSVVLSPGAAHYTSFLSALFSTKYLLSNLSGGSKPCLAPTTL
jgi:hypothetical protein